MRPFSDGLTEYVIRSKAPLLLTHDAQAEGAQLGFTHAAPAQSLLAVPMLAGEKVIGVMTIQDYEKEQVYHQRHLELLSDRGASDDRARQCGTVRDRPAGVWRSTTRKRCCACKPLDSTSPPRLPVWSLLFSTSSKCFPRVADLLRERFGYYHVGVFLTDEKNEWVSLERVEQRELSGTTWKTL